MQYVILAAKINRNSDVCKQIIEESIPELFWVNIVERGVKNVF